MNEDDTPQQEATPEESHITLAELVAKWGDILGALKRKHQIPHTTGLDLLRMGLMYAEAAAKEEAAAKKQETTDE